MFFLLDWYVLNLVCSESWLVLSDVDNDVFIESLLRSLNRDFMHFTKLNLEFSGERVCFCICLT